MTPKMTLKIHYLLVTLLIIVVINYVYDAKGKSAELLITLGQVRTDTNTIDSSASNPEVVLTVWTPGPIHGNDIQQFTAENRNIKLEVTILQNEAQLTEKYLNALSEGNAPDILILRQHMLGSFNTIDKLADISSPPFEIPDGYRQELGEGLWNSHLSFDGQQLIAVPYKYHPLVLFYRADLLEEAGFPSDPIEVEAYLKQLNNWTTMVKEMSRRGIAILEWPTDLTNPITYGQFIFDRNIVFQGNTDSNRKAIDAMKPFRPYAANVSIWDKHGLELLQSGKLAMVIMPDWGESTLSNWLPEQFGKWRVTALPFGLRGIEFNNSLSITVNEQSRHKHEAAKFLGHIMNHSGSMNWINGSLPSEFLGGQYAGLLYQRLIREQPAGVIPTPLDEMAFEIWRSSIWGGSSGEETLELVQQEISDVLGVNQRQLAKYLANRGGSMDSQN